jgi:hypothetical protein
MNAIISDYFMGFPSAVTVCDTEGTIVYMNLKARHTFSPGGGFPLEGKSLFDCHKPESVAKIREIMRTGLPNSYTIEKAGKRKLIHQSPWYDGESIMGLIEISIELPEVLPHFVRS